jgi:two-component system chemotaxis response regulator CheY
MNLPQKDGVAIVREIRQIPAYKGLPIVGFSNASSRATIDSLLLGGASAFFQKPAGIEAMISFLQKLPAFSN